MAQIVINIPDEEYEEIMCDEACGLNTLTRAIAQGKVLPKGHGRLIDVDKLPISPIDITDLPYGKALAVVLLEDIEKAPTVIKADKEEE